MGSNGGREQVTGSSTHSMQFFVAGYMAGVEAVEKPKADFFIVRSLY
jgi:hypothetical protein